MRDLVGMWGCGDVGMWALWYGNEQKVGGGDVRAEALSWDGEWDKAKNKFSALSPLSPTVGCYAPHSHPSPPEEKAASRKKSRLRRKKTAPVAHRTVSCSSAGAGGDSATTVD